MFSVKSGYYRAVTALLVVLCVSFASFSPPAQVYAAGNVPDISAEKCLVADFESGLVLFAKDEDTAHIPASLVKIMTLFIVFDELSSGNITMDDMVTVSEKAWATGGSKMFVLVGSQVRLMDLVHGATVMSGNDACVALAEHVAGSVTAFVDMMNRKAVDMGLTSAHFVDAHGLSNQNRISAKDLFTLARSYATTHPEALPFHGVKEFAYTAPGESEKAPQFNRNRLLWSYPGVYGLKTGYTAEAGFNMVALCERSNFKAIVIALGSAKGKSITDGEKQRTSEITSLFDWVYTNYSHVSVHEPASEIAKARVWKGKGKWVPAVAPHGVSTTVEKGKEGLVTRRVELRTDLEAPLERGATVGEVIFTCGDEEINRVTLLAKDDVSRGNIFLVLWDTVGRALAKAFGRL